MRCAAISSRGQLRPLLHPRDGLKRSPREPGFEETSAPTPPPSGQRSTSKTYATPHGTLLAIFLRASRFEVIGQTLDHFPVACAPRDDFHHDWTPEERRTMARISSGKLPPTGMNGPVSGARSANRARTYPSVRSRLMKDRRRQLPARSALTRPSYARDPNPALSPVCARPSPSRVVLNGWLVTKWGPWRGSAVGPAQPSRRIDPRFSTAGSSGPSRLLAGRHGHDRHRRPFGAPFRRYGVPDQLARS